MQRGVDGGAGSPTSFPDLNLAVPSCGVQTDGLLTAAQLPPNLTPESPASSLLGPIGPYYDLGPGGPVYPGSIGRADQYFRWDGVASGPVQDLPAGGSIYVSHPTQIFQLAEEIDDWGTLSNAERWMASQRADNTTNDIPDYGDGVERIPSVPSMGDDTFMYQIDEGAAYNSAPHTGPFVGHIYTDIEVRDGTTMFALSIDSGPDADPAALAVSVMRSLMAREHAVCG